MGRTLQSQKRTRHVALVYALMIDFSCCVCTVGSSVDQAEWSMWYLQQYSTFATMMGLLCLYEWEIFVYLQREKRLPRYKASVKWLRSLSLSLFFFQSINMTGHVISVCIALIKSNFLLIRSFNHKPVILFVIIVWKILFSIIAVGLYLSGDILEKKVNIQPSKNNLNSLPWMNGSRNLPISSWD